MKQKVLQRRNLIKSPLFLFLGLLAIWGSLETASEANACHKCPLQEAKNRIIVDFKNKSTGNYTLIYSDMEENTAKVGPVNASISFGDYKVTLVSFDYHAKTKEKTQPREMWKLKLNNLSGTLISETGSISDLADGEDWKTEVVNENLTVLEPAFFATAFHSAFPDKSDSNSLYPICAAFDRIFTPGINLEKTANPDSLPFGGGETVYTYKVENSGNIELSNITLVDDKCENVDFIGGDDNDDGKLDTSEVWTYTCAFNLIQTTTNTAKVMGKTDNQNVESMAYAVVTVEPEPIAPKIDLEKTPNPAALPKGGGEVVYAYKVANLGNIELSNITLADDKCGDINFISGDDNTDSKLNIDEIWTYTCSSNLTQTTTNIAKTTGKADGQTVEDTAEAIVSVETDGGSGGGGNGGGGGGGFLFPSIRIIKTPLPIMLLGSGEVEYTYLVSNPGFFSLWDVELTDDKCNEMKFIDGDINSDSKLDRGEIWKYICKTTLTQTTTNTATVTGKSSNGAVSDTTKATVTVGGSVFVQGPAIKLAKTAYPQSFLKDGGEVVYIYKISNPGQFPLSDVSLADDKCSPLNFAGGDINSDSKLDTSEVWSYDCKANVSKTTTNTAEARGQVGGNYATDIAYAEVFVGKVSGISDGAVPKGFPKTGRVENSETGNYKWIIIALGVLASLFGFWRYGKNI